MVWPSCKGASDPTRCGCRDDEPLFPRFDLTLERRNRLK
jgi:hypothetical protein